MGRAVPARWRFFLVITTCSILGGAARAEGERSGRAMFEAELGGEYDSNAHRTEQSSPDVPVTSSPLARGVLRFGVVDVIARRHLISVAATAAGKLFTASDARSEDVAVGQTEGAWRTRLGARTTAGLLWTYYEAFQRRAAYPLRDEYRRDFRSLTPMLELRRAVGESAEVALAAGYRQFVFKPDLDLSFRAPVASLDLRWLRESSDGETEWEIAATGFLELRTFAGRTFIVDCPPPLVLGENCFPKPGLNTRRDSFFAGRLEATRTGRTLLGAGYALHWNSSNSYSETVTRHFALLRLAAPLPGGLYLAARAEIVFASYLHSLFVNQPTPMGGSAFRSIEEENRSNLRVDLSRTLNDRFALLARYTFYINEIGVTSPAVYYRRHTALLSLIVSFGKRSPPP